MNHVSTAASPGSLADVVDLTSADRRAMDALIRKRLRSDVLLVNQVAEYIIHAGGKRLRPLVHLLSARACGYTGRAHVQLAAVIEFIHTATLLHDDVVDGSQKRRGQQAAHQVWGNSASVLVGDFLYSRSFQLMVELDSIRIMAILAETTNTIAAGEVLQLMQLGDTDLDESSYLRVIGDKTACLFSAAARLGAVLSKSDRALEDGLAGFGFALGQAFQITDDWLDYSGQGESLGKNLGDDLSEGKVTLPLILALKAASPADRDFLIETIRAGGTQELDRVRDILVETGALDDSIARAVEFSERACESLSALPPSPERDGLELLARFAVDRSLGAVRPGSGRAQPAHDRPFEPLPPLFEIPVARKARSARRQQHRRAVPTRPFQCHVDGGLDIVRRLAPAPVDGPGFEQAAGDPLAVVRQCHQPAERSAAAMGRDLAPVRAPGHRF